MVGKGNLKAKIQFNVDTIAKLSYEIDHIDSNTTMRTKLITNLEYLLLNYTDGNGEEVPVGLTVNRWDSYGYNRLRN